MPEQPGGIARPALQPCSAFGSALLSRQSPKQKFKFL